MIKKICNKKIYIYKTLLEDKQTSASNKSSKRELRKRMINYKKHVL